MPSDPTPTSTAAREYRDAVAPAIERWDRVRPRWYGSLMLVAGWALCVEELSISSRWWAIPIPVVLMAMGYHYERRGHWEEFRRWLTDDRIFTSEEVMAITARIVATARKKAHDAE